MWKRIESYIINHREELDLDAPGDEVWGKVEKALNPSPRKRALFPVWKVAAVLVFAAGLGYLWQHYNPQLMNLHKGTTSSLLDGYKHVDTGFPELKDLDDHYSAEVDSRMEIIEKYDIAKYPFMEDYLDDLNQAEQSLNEVREDLKEDGLHDPIIQALKQNHEQKLKILDLLIQRLEDADGKSGSPGPSV